MHWGQLDHAEAHLAELRRQAELHRMLKAARSPRPERAPWFRGAVAWIGHQLVALGARLERRYGQAQAAAHTMSLRATQEIDCA